MIYGIGVDIVELARVEEAMSAAESFAAKVLSADERAKFDGFSSQKRKIEFLAGRWAAKEAFAKAYGTGIFHGLALQSLSVDYDAKGRPVFAQTPFDGETQLSISHSERTAIAFVILEKE